MTIEEKVAHLEEQIRTLFQKQNEIHDLTESTHKLAVSVERLTTKMDSHERRIGNLESDKQYKMRTIWASIVGGVLGAGVAALCAIAFG